MAQSAKHEYLMTCPGLPPQPYCSNPWCGKTGGQRVTVNPKTYGGYDYKWLGMDFHHYPPKGEVGDHHAGVIICHECHMKEHGEQPLERDYDPEVGWIVLSPVSGDWEPSSVYDEQRDEVPFECDEESLLSTLGEHADRILELIDVGATADYYLGRELIDALRHSDREALKEWLCDVRQIAPKSFGSWLTKRITYASLPDYAEVVRLGISKGYMVARLVAAGNPLEQVVSDIYSMPRAQFDVQYGLSTEKPKHACPDCGCVHVKKEE